MFNQSIISLFPTENFLTSEQHLPSQNHQNYIRFRIFLDVYDESETLKMLNKFNVFTVKEIGKEDHRLHLQGVLYAPLNSDKIQTKLRNTLCNTVKKINPLRKGNGAYSISSKWGKDEVAKSNLPPLKHVLYHYQYLTKDLSETNPPPVNKYLSVSDIEYFKSNYTEQKEQIIDKSNKFLDYIDEKITYPNHDQKHLVETCIDYLCGEQKARNVSPRIVESYYWLSYYHRFPTDAKVYLTHLVIQQINK